MFLRHLLRRLLHVAILLFAVSLLTFLLARLTPGSFYDDLKLNPQISPAAIAALETRYGAAEPLPAQYARWIRSALAGDFGFSLAYQRSAAGLLLPRAARTLLLTTLALFLSWFIALPAGFYCAAHPRSAVRRFAAAVSSLLLIVPELLGAILVLYFAARWGVLAPAGNLLPPLLLLAALSFPIVFRHSFRAAAEALDHTAIRAARAHGIAGTRLWMRYVLPLAANPLISLFGVSIGALISGSLVAEVVLSWPGLGPLFLEAASARDLDVITGVVLLAAVSLAAGNFIADLLLYAADPRIRTEES